MLRSGEQMCFKFQIFLGEMTCTDAKEKKNSWTLSWLIDHDDAGLRTYQRQQLVQVFVRMS